MASSDENRNDSQYVVVARRYRPQDFSQLLQRRDLLGLLHQVGIVRLDFGEELPCLLNTDETAGPPVQHLRQAARLYAHPETQIVTVHPPRGPRSIEGYVDAALAAEATLELLLARRTEFDAYVISERPARADPCKELAQRLQSPTAR